MILTGGKRVKKREGGREGGGETETEGGRKKELEIEGERE